MGKNTSKATESSFELFSPTTLPKAWIVFDNEWEDLKNSIPKIPTKWHDFKGMGITFHSSALTIILSGVAEFFSDSPRKELLWIYGVVAFLLIVIGTILIKKNKPQVDNIIQQIKELHASFRKANKNKTLAQYRVTGGNTTAD